MSFLSMMEARLPPGFRFHPRDDELVCDYLQMKVVPPGHGYRDYEGVHAWPRLIDVDLNKCEPWDLPEIACVSGNEWYFFSLRDRKYATGQRTNRATRSGYWKATGKDRPVTRKGVLAGMRKTLVFYQGRAPKGRKTDWVMHEFRMETAAGDPPKFSIKEDWVLCRVFFKSRSTGPKQTKEAVNSLLSDGGGTSSLPPLTDTAFCQNHSLMCLEGYEQVPCFSSNPQLPADASSCLMSPLVNGDMKVIRAVLSQLTRLEGGQKREAGMGSGEGGVGSYFSPEAALQNMW